MSDPLRSGPKADATKSPFLGIWSDSPNQAWTEQFILAQTPVWIFAVAFVMLTGLIRRMTEGQLMVLSVTVAAAPIILPALLLRSRPDRALPYAHCYWVKLNAWIGIVVFFGTYFGTHYFFDLMGMRYAFPAEWHLESFVVGGGGNGNCISSSDGSDGGRRVPLFMYPLTHAFYMTYFVLLRVTERALLLRLVAPSTSSSSPIARILTRSMVVLGLSYALAFLETFFMASRFLTGLFDYENHGRMLSVGSFGYASYFIVGLPMVRRVDDARGVSLGNVAVEALATSMGIQLLLEAWSLVIGPL